MTLALISKDFIFSWRFRTCFVACQSQDGAHANVMAELAAAPYVKAMKKDSTDDRFSSKQFLFKYPLEV